MAEKRKARKKKDPQDNVPPPPEVATKEEYTIAKWIRKNVPIKKTKFLNHQVEYFTACKAVDQLLDSPWSKPSKSGGDALFTTRESISDYLDLMLRHKFFHRARKIVVPESELNKGKKKKEKDKENKDKDKSKEETDKKSKSDDKQKEKEKEEKVDDEDKKDESSALIDESSQAEGKKSEKKKGKKKKEESEKKKRKVRLDMHLEQRFVDGNDAYVWLYEPTPYYYYFFGFLVVIAVIAICLFPLWPPSVRQGVYYLSLAAAGFLVAILALAVLRLVVYCLIWCISFGRHHFWLLPNLTEDVSFLQSFWPLYKYEYKGGDQEDDEDEEEEDKGESKDENDTPEKDSSEKDGSEKADNSESDGSHPSQTDRDYEIVDREEIES